MWCSKVYLIGIMLLGASVSYAQKTDRDYLRSGNKLYNDSLFVKAEVDYRKALEINPKSADAMFNLGNSLLMQQKGKEAMEQFWRKIRKSWLIYIIIWGLYFNRQSNCRSV